MHFIASSEGGEVFPQLVVVGSGLALDWRLLEPPVYALNSTIDPRVVWLGELILDVVRPADLFEAVDAERADGLRYCLN